MDDVHLAGDEGLDHLRPAAQQHRLLRLDSLRLEQTVGVRDQEWRRIGDRQVADPYRRVGPLGTRLVAPEEWQRAGGGKQCRQLQGITAGESAAGEAFDTHDRRS
jgi:hypothetical protein